MEPRNTYNCDWKSPPPKIMCWRIIRISSQHFLFFSNITPDAGFVSSKIFSLKFTFPWNYSGNVHHTRVTCMWTSRVFDHLKRVLKASINEPAARMQNGFEHKKPGESLSRNNRCSMSSDTLKLPSISCFSLLKSHSQLKQDQLCIDLLFAIPEGGLGLI
jgi:hypothetical protein